VETTGPFEPQGAKRNDNTILKKGLKSYRKKLELGN
jgi:hypothetical protein